MKISSLYNSTKIFLISSLLFCLVVSSYSINVKAAAVGDIVPDTSFTGELLTDFKDQLKRMDHSALENLKMIDFFLCIMKVRGDLFPNANYKAQVNEAACQLLAGDSDENAPKVQMADITLSCTRASNSSPQICKSWYSVAGEANMYLVKVQLDVEPTEAKPNGEFSFSWCQASSIDGTCKPSEFSYGRLEVTNDGSGNTVVNLYDEFGGNLLANLTSEGQKLYNQSSVQITSAQSIRSALSFSLSSHKLNSATGTNTAMGDTYDSSLDSGNGGIKLTGDDTYNIDFNETHGLIKKNSASAACFDVGDNDEYVMQYDLYDEVTHAKKLIAGGIPVTVASTDGSANAAAVGSRGWWSYWGLWIDGSTNASLKTVAAGQKVTAQAASSANSIAIGDELTVKKAPGVLRTETRYTGTIPAVDQASATTTMWYYFPSGKTFIYWTTDGSGNKIVKSVGSGTDWSGSSFNANTDLTARIEWCGATTVTNNHCFGAHSETIGGWFVLSDVSSNTYTARTSQRTLPGTVSTDQFFKCYGDRCYKPTDGGTLSTIGFGSTEFAAMDNSSHRDSYVNPTGGTPNYYVFESDNLTMYRCQAWDGVGNECTGDRYPVMCATNDGSSNSCSETDWNNSTWLNLVLVAHDTTVSNWSDFDGATQYVWQTSNNVYGEKLVWPFKSSTSSTISFDAPVNFVYDHVTAHDRNSSATYNGKKFGLEYGGNGNLWGFDWSKLDPACASDCDYGPQTNLRDGLVVDLGASDGGKHIVLGTRINLKPSSLAESICTSAPHNLSVASSTALPSDPGPSLSTYIDFTANDMPTGSSLISTEVCVVDNVLTGAPGCPTE